MKNKKQKTSLFYWTTFIISFILAFSIGFLISTFAQRNTEKQFVYKPKVEIRNLEPRNEIWGENFPKQYETYYQTADTSFKSKYNGNTMIDMLEVDPRLVVLWAGYSFSKDYKQGRGHVHAIDDVINILRTGGPTSDSDGPMPTTCWTCKGPDVPRMMKEEGIANFYKGKWSRLGHQIVNPIGCADCHDEKTMKLTITRPALIEAFRRMGKDIQKATHQEMRSLVCAQCHVEYYFDKRPDKSNYLTLPWDKGQSVEQMEAYYDERGFKDWIHKLSKAPMLKAQHPGYEVYLTGIHAKRGVSCADCHMPYKSEGGQKFSDHKIQSPLNNIANSCQVCHREKTEQLIKDVYERQDKIIQGRDKLEEYLVRAHVEAKTAWDKGATDEDMKEILMDIRHAQWRWDYAAAGHGHSFHSPVETSRVVSTGLDIVQKCRIKLARLLAKLGHNKPVPYPDISTKAQAQAFIGLPMEKLRAEKKSFKEKLVPQWIKKAEERQKTWGNLII